MDDDIGWNDFALRNYDAQIGRWVQMDPFEEFASPYIGMGADPINLTDPSGGSVGTPIKLFGTMSQTAATAITLGEAVVRSVSTVSKSVTTISTLVKVANITGKVFQVANVINNSISSVGIGEIESPGNWYRYQEGKDIGYFYWHPDQKIQFDKNNATLLEGDDLNRIVFGRNGNTEVNLYADGTFNVASPNPEVGTVNGHIGWTMSLENGGKLFITARDKGAEMRYYTSKGVGDGSFWGGAAWLVGGKAWGLAFNVSTKVVAKGIAVIGPRATYRQFAQSIGARYLNVSDKAWTWAKNKKFLDGVIKRGDDVMFGGKFDPAKLDPKSVLAREINYLTNNGYKWTEDFSKLIKQ